MKKVLKKISVFFTGLILILIILEICLRIIGYIHAKNTSSDLDRQGKNDYTILSIGDSFTEGVGAPKDKDYPTQLQQILNSKTNKTFKVVNVARAGDNTAQILNKLQLQINTVKPDLIILLIGGSNKWNLWGYDNPSISHGKSINKSANNLLYRIRIYKLIKLLYLDISKKNKFIYNNKIAIQQLKKNTYKDPINNNNYFNYFSIGLSYYNIKNYEQSLKYFKKAVILNTKKSYDISWYISDIFNKTKQNKELIKWIKKEIVKNPQNIQLWQLIQAKYESLGKHPEKQKWYAKAINKLKENIKAEPTNYDNYLAIDYAKNTMHQNAKLIKWYEKYIKQNPENVISYYMLAKQYAYLKKCGKSQEWFDKAIDLFKKEIKTSSPKQIKPDDYITFFNNNLINQDDKFINWYKKEMKKNPTLLNTQDIDELNILENSLTMNWMKSDIEKIIKICKTQKIKIIMQNYPYKCTSPNQRNLPENIILTNFAKQHNIPLVDNKKIFDSLGTEKDNFFAPDGHCNAKGYKLMAQSIYNKILEENIFNMDTIKTKNDSLIVN